MLEQLQFRVKGTCMGMLGGRRDASGSLDALRNDSNGTATTLARSAAQTLGGLMGRSRISPRPKQDPVFYVLLLPIVGLVGQLATYNAVHAMLFRVSLRCCMQKMLFSEADLSPCYCA